LKDLQLTKEKAMNLGKRVRGLREANNMTQAQLEENTGIKREYLSKVESGKLNPTYTTLLKIAHGLRISLSEMLKDNLTPSPQIIRAEFAEKQYKETIRKLEIIHEKIGALLKEKV
jgi:transcriptional regulator with XRE-family HTH domain